MAPIPAMTATSNAKKRLIAAHQDEYDRYLAEEREKLGLPANPEQAKLMAKKAKLEKQLAEINGQLNGN
jgi:hypothetical protein